MTKLICVFTVNVIDLKLKNITYHTPSYLIQSLFHKTPDYGHERKAQNHS